MATLSSDVDPILDRKDRLSLNICEKWTSKWPVHGNEIKSAHITFTLIVGDFPDIHLNKINKFCQSVK